MPKNIILCSDGTGNAGGKSNGTNVWRLFLAIDHDPIGNWHQTAFYDDGVGTEDFKYARMIGGAFGWGLSRNLTQLMGFLLRQYQEGDRLYLFGFSRGAFTIRVLANMIRLCGIPNCSGKTPDETNGCAAAALTAYKDRDASTGGGAAVAEFRRTNKIPSERAYEIHFIGVWDTVEAIGLPFAEMKQGLYRLFPLRMRDEERDLHENILNARHALSVDDERLTFWPMLWDEGGEGRPTVKQVWFPGVHSNVGGGYAKDQLSLISLDWMMREANDCGLQFYADLWAQYQRDADEDGQGYDSRAGLGMFYRYAPRRVDHLCAEKGVKVTLHESVLHRIALGTDDYAPGGVPAKYEIEPWPGPWHAAAPREVEGGPARRAQQLVAVHDVIWWRRVVYTLFVGGVVIAVALAWLGRTLNAVVDVGTWDYASRLGYHLLDPLISVAQWATPAYFEPGVIAVRHHPLAAIGAGVVLAFILWVNGRLKRTYRNLVVKAWRTSLGAAATPGAQAGGSAGNAEKPKWWMSLARVLRHNPLALAAQRFWIWIGPYVTVAGLLLAFLWVGARYLVPAVWLANNPSVAAAPGGGAGAARKDDKFLRPASGPVTVIFDTRNSLQPTNCILIEGEKYRLRVVKYEGWFDKTLPAKPDGLTVEPAPVQKATGQLRRDPQEPWYKLLGSVGPGLYDSFPIGSETYYRAPRNGRLYLYVNDTLLTYGNNHGTAEIEVQCVTPDAPPPVPPSLGRQ